MSNKNNNEHGILKNWRRLDYWFFLMHFVELICVIAIMWVLIIKL